jgi:hypothetical protein
MDTYVSIILPQDSRCYRHPGVLGVLHEWVMPQKTPKTLILLHGLSDNYSGWGNRTSILRYADGKSGGVSHRLAGAGGRRPFHSGARTRTLGPTGPMHKHTAGV